MDDKTYTIGGFAELTGMTIRTLRYYDRIGLLKPSSYNEHGHRLYTKDELYHIQKIITLKYLDFSLEDIGKYLENNEQGLKSTLKSQSKLLQDRKIHLENVLNTIKRVEFIIDEQGVDIGSDLVLGLIHALQNEEVQKEQLSHHLSPDLITRMFMEDVSQEEKIELEKRMMNILSEIRIFIEEERSIDDIEVRTKGHELLSLLSETFESEQIEELHSMSSGNGENMQMFNKIMSDEMEEYLSQLLESLEEEGGIR